MSDIITSSPPADADPTPKSKPLRVTGSFFLPRGHLPNDVHDSSYLSLSSKFPQPRVNTPVLDGDGVNGGGGGEEGGEESVFGPSSKIGRRTLEGEEDPWRFNAWDNVEWDEEQDEIAKTAIAKQTASPVPDDLKRQLNATPANFWDAFYSTRKDTFFKDRAWLRNEFEALAKAVEPGAGPVRIAELGCGPGNTVFPLLSVNENPDLHLYALDYSCKAVDLVKANPAYDPKVCTAAVWDISSADGPPKEVERNSLDVVVMIFVFSALHPLDWPQAVANLSSMLKPGGVLLFRDYGRHDLAQLRMKGGRLMEENLYIRGDGTRVYFFERGSLTLFDRGYVDELVKIFCGDTPASAEEQSTPPSLATGPFELVKLGVDRRLLLNRARKLKMFRVWLQGEFRKPMSTVLVDSV